MLNEEDNLALFKLIKTELEKPDSDFDQESLVSKINDNQHILSYVINEKDTVIHKSAINYDDLEGYKHSIIGLAILNKKTEFLKLLQVEGFLDFKKHIVYYESERDRYFTIFGYAVKLQNANARLEETKRQLRKHDALPAKSGEESSVFKDYVKFLIDNSGEQGQAPAYFLRTRRDEVCHPFFSIKESRAQEMEKISDFLGLENEEFKCYVTVFGYVAQECINLAELLMPKLKENYKEFYQTKGLVYDYGGHETVCYLLEIENIDKSMTNSKEFYQQPVKILKDGSYITAFGHIIFGIFAYLNKELFKDEKLHEQKAFVYKDSRYITAFQIAIKDCQERCVKLFISKDSSSVDFELDIDESKVSVLKYAVDLYKKDEEKLRPSRFSIIKIILDNGAKFEEIESQADLPLPIKTEIEKIKETKKFYESNQVRIKKEGIESQDDLSLLIKTEIEKIKETKKFYESNQVRIKKEEIESQDDLSLPIKPEIEKIKETKKFYESNQGRIKRIDEIDPASIDDNINIEYLKYLCNQSKVSDKKNTQKKIKGETIKNYEDKESAKSQQNIKKRTFKDSEFEEGLSDKRSKIDQQNPRQELGERVIKNSEDLSSHFPNSTVKSPNSPAKYPNSSAKSPKGHD